MGPNGNVHVWSLAGKPFRVADPARLERHPVGWLQKQKGLRRAIPYWTKIPPMLPKGISMEVRRYRAMGSESGLYKGDV